VKMETPRTTSMAVAQSSRSLGRKSSFSRLPSDSGIAITLNRENIAKLFPVLSGIFMVNINVSLIAAFFPLHATEYYGASKVVIGVIFSAYPFTIMLAAPFMGLLCNLFGCKPVLSAGLFIASCGSFVFGSARHLYVFLFGRIIQGLGSSAVVVACTALNTANFPRSLGSVMGMQEVATGLGFMIGPSVGGALVKLGFEVPFFVMGSLVLVVFFISVLLHRHQSQAEEGEKIDAAEEDSASFSQVFSCSTMLVAGSAFWATASVGFIDPTWGVHLNRVLGLSPAEVGGMFVIPAGFFAVCGGLAGVASDKFGPKRVMMTGFVVLCLGWGFIGPVPLVYTGRHDVSMATAFANQIICVALIGAGVGTVLIPSLPALNMAVHASERQRKAAKKDRCEHADEKQPQQSLGNLTAAVFACFQAMGEAVGPLLGSALDEVAPPSQVIHCQGNSTVVKMATPGGMGCESRFPWASTYMGIIVAAYSLVVLVCMNLGDVVASPLLPPLVDKSDTGMELGSCNISSNIQHHTEAKQPDEFAV
jgi:MFS family permease